MRTTTLQNHLGDLSRGPSSFSRKSLSRQSLDSNSHASDTSDAPNDHHRACATACICGGGVGAFLSSLGLLAVASLILGAMSLLLLASVAQEQPDVTGDRGTANGVSPESDAVGGSDASVDSSGGGGGSGGGGEGSDAARGENTYSISEASQDSSSSAARTSKRSSGANTKATSGSSNLAVSRDTTQSELQTAGHFPLPGQRAETLTRNRSSGASLSGPWALPTLMEAAIAMATLVLVADLCCLMVCCMQCFFAAKLLTMHEGEGR